MEVFKASYLRHFEFSFEKLFHQKFFQPVVLAMLFILFRLLGLYIHVQENSYTF